jgi:hypothetical protein
MNARKLFASSLALAAVLATVTVSAPAEAQSLKSIFNNLTGRGGGGYNANASVTINALQNTAATLDSMISNGLATGRISPAQASNFRAQLSQIAGAQNNMIASGTLNASAVQSLTGQYTSLTTQVNAALSGSYGGNFGYGVPGYYNSGYGVNPYAQYNNYFGGLNSPWY